MIGGGLAGSEAAWQLASRGHPVRLHEMRPVRQTPAHKTDRLAELTHGEARTLATGSHMPVLTNGPELASLIQRAAAAPGRP